MLKTIAGVLKPTKGSVTVNGSIAPLIELGAGFDMDLTARENVFLNGALLGYSRKQMQEYYDDIVEFSELKDFMDVPEKNFSFWYGFKIGICDCNNRNAGYSYCRRSAFCWGLSIPREMRTTYTEDDEWRNDNSFVSHNINQVEKLCNKIVWLEKGVVKAFGDAKEIAEEYRNS